PGCLTSRRASAFAMALATAAGIRRGRRCKLTATGDATAASPEAVVVGAGPAGLAAALMLSQRGWKVKVLEKTPDPASYDPGKGFMYLIDGRGQKCLQELNPELFAKLVESSVGMADAKIGVLTPKGLTESVNPIKDSSRKSYWIPRHAFVGLLLEEAKKKENISLSVEVEIDDIVFDGQFHDLYSLEPTAIALSYGTSYLVVNRTLEAMDGAKGHFAVDARNSPSAGLRYKVLTLPGEFKLDTPAGEKVIRLLLEANADKDKATPGGATPLYIAAKNGHLEVVRLLLEANADKDKAFRDGATPLFMAAYSGQLEVVVLLLEAKADKDKTMNDGRTPLFIAAQNGHLEVVRLLLEAKADKDKAHQDGTTPVCIADQNEHFEVLQVLRIEGQGQA
ncbi:CTTNBP2, partial [Symbiodinium sp. KB8]